MMPPTMNSTGTIEKLKTPKNGYISGRSEKILKITRATMMIKTIPADLVNQSSKTSRMKLARVILSSSGSGFGNTGSSSTSDSGGSGSRETGSAGAEAASRRPRRNGRVK